MLFEALYGGGMGRYREQAAIAAATETAEWDSNRHGLVVTFERIVIVGDAAVASFIVGDGRRRMIVSLERTDGDWDALQSTVLGPGDGGFESFRPSEHRPDHWTIIAAGLAPEGSRTAVISFAGEQHAVPVVNHVYLYAIGVEGGLGEPFALAPDVFVEKHSAELGELRGPVLEHAQDRLAVGNLEREHLQLAPPCVLEPVGQLVEFGVLEPAGELEHTRVWHL